MKTRISAFILSLCAAGSAVAGPTAVQEVAAETGMREREVRMLVGAHSAFAEYRTSYQRLRDKAARRGLDLRALVVIDRHARELDRAVAFSMKVQARQTAPVLVAGR